ncbi:MAG: helix-turn-helix transcriptional regulator [Hyphomicrobiaceae bacterium]
MAFAPEFDSGRRRNIEDLLRLLEQISSTNEVEEARQRFDAFSTRLGFCSCACLNVPSQPQEPLTVVEVSRQDNAFWAEYREQRLYMFDPVLARAARSSMCLAWSEIEKTNHPDANEQRVFDCARQYGVTDGISVPIHQTGNGFALVSLIGNPATMNQSVRLVIHLAVTAVYTQFSALFHAETIQDRALTRRQIEIVAWLAVGKSDWEISQILGVSPKTVNFHVENIKRKYGVATRIQAIVAAMRDGLLPQGLQVGQNAVDQ